MKEVMAERAMARKEAKEQRKVARETAEHARHVATHDTLQPRVQKGSNKNLHAGGKEESEINEEAVDNDEELQSWCLLEESEHEQWPKVISRKCSEQSRACLTAECGRQ